MSLCACPADLLFHLPSCEVAPGQPKSEARFDRDAAIDAGELAQMRADAGAPEDWKAAADAAIARVCAQLHEWDADDVWEIGGLDRTVENRALGPRLVAAARAGLCVPTDNYRRSRQVNCHGMPRRIWRSLVA